MCGAEHPDCRSANFQLTGSRREVCKEKAKCITKLDPTAHGIERRCTTAADIRGCIDLTVQCVTCNTPYCNNEKCRFTIDLNAIR